LTGAKSGWKVVGALVQLTRRHGKSGGGPMGRVKGENPQGWWRGRALKRSRKQERKEIKGSPARAQLDGGKKLKKRKGKTRDPTGVPGRKGQSRGGKTSTFKPDPGAWSNKTNALRQSNIETVFFGRKEAKANKEKRNRKQSLIFNQLDKMHPFELLNLFSRGKFKNRKKGTLLWKKEEANVGSGRGK